MHIYLEILWNLFYSSKNLSPCIRLGGVIMKHNWDYPFYTVKKIRYHCSFYPVLDMKKSCSYDKKNFDLKNSDGFFLPEIIRWWWQKWHRQDVPVPFKDIFLNEKRHKNFISHLTSFHFKKENVNMIIS